MPFDLPTFTLIHVVLSVLGLISGLVVAGGLMSGARLDGWTAFFLSTTVATSITGYGFPADKVLPSHIVGASRLWPWRSVCGHATARRWLAAGAGPMW